VRALGILMLFCLLGGCGHRGPLYLPGKSGDPAFDRQNRDARGDQAPTRRPAISRPSPNEERDQ